MTIYCGLAPRVHANEAELQAIIDSGSLAESPNSILLDYLLNEGQDALPTDLHEEAVDQMVAALRDQTLVEPLASMGDILAAANPMKMMGGAKGMMKMVGTGMLRGATQGGTGSQSGPGSLSMQIQQEIGSAMIDPWVRGLGAARTLAQARYANDATRFYRGCLTSIGSVVPLGSKNDWLQDECIRGALVMGPEDAGALFAELWEEPYIQSGFGPDAQEKDREVSPEIQAVAAQGLGKLVGSDQLSSEQRVAVMRALIDMVEMKKPDLTALTGTVQGLSFAEDPQAVEPLRRLWKKGKPKEIRPIAMGALVAVYREPDAIEAMRKELQTGTGTGGTLNSFAPWTSDSNSGQQRRNDEAEARYLAARTLIRAGDDAGYEFAAKFLDRQNTPSGSWDFRPDLIRDLVETGGERARSLLEQRVEDGHPNEWLEAMMRTGLLELGDSSQIPALLPLIEKQDWDFGRGTAASWYKRFKPLLWQGVKMAVKSYLGQPPRQQDLERTQQIISNMAWGERDRIRDRKIERELRTDQFRWQVADSASELDDPGCLSLLAPLLDDEEASVRLSAVSALLEQSEPSAANLLVRALELDYGEEDEVSRNPEIQAAIIRRLVSGFPKNPATRQALALAAHTDSASLRFMALTAERELADFKADEG